MSLGRAQAAGLALLLATMAGALFATCTSPRFALLWSPAAAQWIASPEPPVSTGVVAAPRDHLHVVAFEKRFRVARETPVSLSWQALRGFALEWNGHVVARRGWDEGDWRQPGTLALRALPGENVLRVRVRNPNGPPLLRLDVRGEDVELATDESWLARRDDGPALPARHPDDRRRAAAALAAPRLAQSLAARGAGLGGLALAAALGAVALGRADPDRRRRWGLRALAAAGGLLWLGLAWRAGSLPAWTGFDGPDHLAYVHWILEHGALPLAGDGPQTHHPPLFYLLGAGLRTLLPGVPEAWTLRGITWCSGLVQVGVAYALARRLRPESSATAPLAAAAAAFLPLNLYMSVYVGNEPLHAALAALALWAGVELLLHDGTPRWWRPLGLGALVGAAMLAKVSSLLWLPLAAGFVVLRRWLVDDRTPTAPAPPPATGLVPALGRGALVLAGAALVSGGWFVRSRLVLGRWLVGNWNVPGNEIAWWQHPGFHTPGYYLHFGAVFDRPWFASFASFADGIYSTLWGDGLVGGVSAWVHRPALWDYDWMAVGYLLALPATAMALHGFAALAHRAVRDPEPRRRLALSFVLTCVLVTGFATLAITFEVPAYSMTKASYALSLTAPLAVAMAEGFDRWRRACAGRPALRTALDAWAATFAAAVALAFLTGGGGAAG